VFVDQPVGSVAGVDIKSQEVGSVVCAESAKQANSSIEV